MEDLKNQQQRMMMPPKRNGSPDDFYTPDYAIAPLIPYLNKDWKIWECACGTGSINNEIVKSECECEDFIINKARMQPCKHLIETLNLIKVICGVK
jgi:hypothetical protein